MHRLLWGILLGLVLTFSLPFLVMIVTALRVAEPQDSMLVSVAFILFCLLGVILFKVGGSTRQMRVVRGRTREDEE